MTVQELRSLIDEKTQEINKYVASKDADKAQEALDEKRKLTQLLAIAEAEEEFDKRSLEGQKAGRSKADVVNEMRAAVKFALKGKESLTDEERAAVSIDNNAAILPEEFVNEMQILREGFPSLKKHCHVVKARSNHGKMPFARIGGKKLTKYKSGTKLTGEVANTEDVPYDIENYGSLVPIANDLQEDEAIDIINEVIKPDFAEAAVNTENEEIMTIVSESATEVPGTSYKDIKAAIDGTLPALRAKTITITNLEGYVYLMSQEDKQGRNLELVKNVNGVDYYEKKVLETLSNEEVVSPEGHYVFYVVNLYALAKFFERKGYTVSTDKSVFFESDETALKVQERFDVEKLDDRYVKKVLVPKA